MNYKRQGALIKAARLKKGWTQQELANFTGYKSRQAICNVENGRRRPEDIDLMASLLTINVNALKYRIADKAEKGRIE